MKIKYYCLTEDCECPYYKNGFCELDNPEEECDDYATLCAEYEPSDIDED